MRKLFVLLSLLVVASMALAACGTPATAAPTEQPPAEPSSQLHGLPAPPVVTETLATDEAPMIGPPAPTCQTPDGYDDNKFLMNNEGFNVAYNDATVVNVIWIDSNLVVISERGQKTAPITLGEHTITFVLADDEGPIAIGQLLVYRVQEGCLYYKTPEFSLPPSDLNG